ncbi:MAG: LamG domain-containing protein [Patescibacteria group bacterium]
MLYLLFTISYLLDIVLLILLIFLVFSVAQAIKSLGQQLSFQEKLKIAPQLLLQKPADSFDDLAQKDNKGTYAASFHQHKNVNGLMKKIIGSTLGFLAIKLVIVSLIFLNIPREGDAQPKVYSALYQAKEATDFAKGKFNLAQWDDNSITLQAGQLAGSYISQPIGSDKTISQWKSLSWEMDNNYNQKPVYPKGIMAIWDFDSLDNCTAAAYAKYKCQNNLVGLTRGIYNSNAYKFDGYKSMVKIPQNITFTGSFTIGAWIQPSVNTLNGSEDQNFAIFTKAYGDYADKKPYELKYNLFFGFKNGSLSLMYWPDGNKEHWVIGQNNKFNFEKGSWYHVAAVYDDKAKTIKIYINGIECTNISQNYDGAAIKLSPKLSLDNFPSWLGCVGYRWQDKEEKMLNVFKGDMDEVFLANAAFGLMDIRKLVNQSGEIMFQVRTGDKLPLQGDFWGPKGDRTAFFTSPKNNDLAFLNQSRYLQYIIYLYRPNTNFEPKVTDVNVEYFTTEENNIQASLQADNSAGQPSSQLFERDFEKERQAIDLFIQFFKTKPASDLDWQFVNMVAYNQAEERDLTKEAIAIRAFANYMKRLPTSNLDWGIVKALAYNDKGTILLMKWLKLK